MSKLLRRNALFVFPGICVGLGLWQMYRLKQKESLISVMQARLNEPPKPFDTPYTKQRLASFEHSRILVEGEFIHEGEMLIGPRNKGGPGRQGYFVYTPLKLNDGGWIPVSHVDQESRRRLSDKALPEGQTRVFGMLRQAKYYQPDRSFWWILPSVKVQQESKHPVWIWVDLDAMNEHVKRFTKADTIDAYFIEEVLLDEDTDDLTREMKAWQAESEERSKINASMPSALAAVKMLNSDPRMFYGKPIISSPSINVPNKHLGYIYTWFSLAGFLLLVMRLSKRRPKRF